MPKAAVRDIIVRINALDRSDRLALERELARRIEREWSTEVKRARKTARGRGIDQAAIDRAIERRRYGR